MHSLLELRASHAPLLLLDAASTRIQAGLLAAEAAEDRWAEAETEAGIGIFTAISSLDLTLEQIRAFVFCEGPGSILGIRTAAMAIRTWNVLQARPVFCYGSLALLAHALDRPGLQVIADARRDSWHRFTVDRGLERVSTADLTGPLLIPEEFRHWSTLPPQTRTTPYGVEKLLAVAATAGLFTPTDAPDAFLHEEPSYKVWTPQIHRAP